MGKSYTQQIDRVILILRDIIRLKPRLKAVVPEQLAQLKERLTSLNPEGGSGRATDYDLFFRIGLILQGRQESLTMGELSEELSVPLSTATRMIDWLVESDYVERLPGREDRRIVRVALTQTGQALYKTIIDFMRQRLTQILKQFTETELENLLFLMEKLIKGLEEIDE
ncbi:MAG: MarR family transcriptional regulator [Spirochaetota bacterium]